MGSGAKGGQGNHGAAEAAETLYLNALRQRDKHKALLEEAQEQHSFSPDTNERSRKMAEKRKINSPLHDIVQTQSNNQILPTGDFNLCETEVPIYDVPFPFPYNTKTESHTMIGATDNDNGSQLINEFEHKMKEILDEWRSLEHV
ncbi:hypothetical protein LSM04_005689 [Trypanosoma melophagium]|uniref:uncharacterized protein n=1 Tax=Trypanosoma melophagium TaxID=715481 RepID=UPI00351A1851|nr:hypothetical protein LSM04_005689 [Trypanosoma melophagium]